MALTTLINLDLDTPWSMDFSVKMTHWQAPLWEATYWGQVTTMNLSMEQILILAWPALPREWLSRLLKPLTTSWHLSWLTSFMPLSATTFFLDLTLPQGTSSVVATQESPVGTFTEKPVQVQPLGTGVLGPVIFQNLTGQSFSLCIQVFKILILSLVVLLRIHFVELFLVQPLLA